MHNTIEFLDQILKKVSSLPNIKELDKQIKTDLTNSLFQLDSDNSEIQKIAALTLEKDVFEKALKTETLPALKREISGSQISKKILENLSTQVLTQSQNRDWHKFLAEVFYEREDHSLGELHEAIYKSLEGEEPIQKTSANPALAFPQFENTFRSNPISALSEFQESYEIPLYVGFNEKYSSKTQISKRDAIETVGSTDEMQAKASKYGFTYKEAPCSSIGSCMFDSVVAQVPGQEAKNLRQTVYEHMKKFATNYKDFILNEGDTFDAYLENLRQPTTWASHPELIAISRILNMHVVVIATHTQKPMLIHQPGATNTIYLASRSEVHYMILEEVQSNAKSSMQAKLYTQEAGRYTEADYDEDGPKLREQMVKTEQDDDDEPRIEGDSKRKRTTT